MHVAFAVTFGVFVVLMAGLVVFVLRFAVRQGRRRAPLPKPGELDEASPAALVDDPDEGGDAEE